MPESGKITLLLNLKITAFISKVAFLQPIFCNLQKMHLQIRFYLATNGNTVLNQFMNLQLNIIRIQA